MSNILKPATITPLQRATLVMLHDAVMTCGAVLLAFFLRFDAAGVEARIPTLQWFLPGYALIACGVFSLFNLYRTKWRFASLPDLVNIFKASTVLALSLLMIDYTLVSSKFYGTLLFGKITLFLYWLLQIFALGSTRIVYRYYRYLHTRKQGRTEDKASALLIGNAADADVVLRGIESGAIKNLWALGVISPSEADRAQSVRLIPVLGRVQDLEKILYDMEQNQQRPHKLVLLPSVLSDPQIAEFALVASRKFGIQLQRLPVLDGVSSGAINLAPLDIEDLLFRETIAIDYEKLSALIRGKKVVVTGGAGSIGSEICRRVTDFDAADLMILDHAEPALYAVTQELSKRSTQTKLHTHLADVRDEARLTELLTRFNPDLVFHAAALKHVPIIEQDWAEGLRTNIFGTINLCRAAEKASAKTVVIISTDKAVEPVSILGISKRFSELYCAALDQEKRSATRFIAVRFGNVLGSSGSVVPLFKQQIAQGGPVTVTHTSMLRYFMTMREACDLVLSASSHAEQDLKQQTSVYVLNMGQPVRILDLAEKMIRLSGFTPNKEIQISISGLRAGERLHEGLFAHNEVQNDIGVAGMMAAYTPAPERQNMDETAEALSDALQKKDRLKALKLLKAMMPDMRMPSSVVEFAETNPIHTLTEQTKTKQK